MSWPAGLPSSADVRDEVEHVVDDLEREPVSGTEVGERLDVFARQVGHERPDATGGAEKGGRLAGDGCEIVLDGPVGVVGVLQLEELSLTQPPDGGGQQRGDLDTERRRQLGGTGQQEVTGENRPVVAPDGVHRLHRPSSGGVVHDVVVVERSQMHQFDRNRSADDLVGGGLI